jgi:hypothetical protein
MLLLGTALAIPMSALAALVGFYLRQRRAPNPLYDLRVASRRTFWAQIAASDKSITDSTQAEVAAQHPQYADTIVAGGEAGVPRRRRLGVHRRNDRDRARRRPRLRALPEARRGGPHARGVPRRGQRPLPPRRQTSG